jgi:xanthine dehydrogenase iron-sulfur cluster and FAD-binding subunit A
VTDEHLHHVQRSGQRIARYEAPGSLDAALALLAEHGDAARPIAGGTDLIVELDRNARRGVSVLVDLGRIPGLADIADGGDHLVLGPMTTHNQVARSELCRAEAGPLVQACWEVGSAQLRNRATVAGNIVTASPANDTLSALLALGASVRLTSLTGERTLPVADVVTGFRTTALTPGELITAIIVPKLGELRRGVFVKLGNRRAQAISVVHVAMVVGSDSEGAVTEARIALGSVAPTVVLADAAGELIGGPLSRERIAACADAVAAGIIPIDDVRATAAYRSATIGVMIRRGLEAIATGTVALPAADTCLAGGTGGRFPTGEALATSVGADDVVTATINGAPVTAANAVGKALLDWLRADVGLTGTKEGCAEGECGACTVHLDGMAVMSCLVPAARAQGADVTTVEGLAPSGDGLHPIQQAFIDGTAVQCGYCIPGFLMAGAKLIEEHAVPSREQVLTGLAGNLCRCTGYYSIIDAVTEAAVEVSR